MINIFIALLLTLIIETPIYYLLVRFLKRKKISDLLVVILLNVVTNLSLNIFLRYIPIEYVYILLIELLIVVIEGLFLFFYLGFKYQGLMGSLIANVFSFFIGEAYNYFLCPFIRDYNLIYIVLSIFIVIFVLEFIFLLLHLIRIKKEEE